MNWCQPHWDMLRQAIIDRGMDHLGAQTGEQAASDIQEQVEGGEAPFDPLMGSFWAINNEMVQSLKSMGRAHEILELKCPLCILVADGQPEVVLNWINGATDGAKVHAIQIGLLKTS